MKNLYKNEQSGRSMVEMLGVLAIIGVLSIGGISGYSKAMSKFRINKTLDQVSMLVMNIRSLFASSLDYTGLNNELAYTMGIIPGEMLAKSGEAPTGDGGVVNAFQGEVIIKEGEDTAREFTISYAGLTQEACISIATADWGSQAGSGLKSISVGGTEYASETAGETGETLPINIKEASKSCGTSSNSTATIEWTYY